jgi:hypothetical protein
MQLLPRSLLSLLALLLSACAPSQPAATPAPPSASPEEDDSEGIDFRQESPEQPFEVINPLRGPALSINGLRFTGAKGSVAAMISAHAETDDVVVLFWPGAGMSPDWLDACPRSTEDPERPRVAIELEGVGDLSDNVLELEEALWSTSMKTELYTPLTALRLVICGAPYALEPQYAERFSKHAQLAAERAGSAEASSR